MTDLVVDEAIRVQLDARSPTPFWQRQIADLRKEMRDTCQAGGGAPEPVDSADDVDADGVRARLYQPEGKERDVLVWMHGGGWMLGDLDCHDSLARALANRAGCAVLSIDYRLAPEHSFPAAIEDAWTATSWALRRFEQVAVGGDSSGGNLAAAVALRARDRGIELMHQLLVYPVLDCDVDSTFYREFRRRYRDFGGFDFGAEAQEGIRHIWELYVPDTSQRANPDASPMRAASLAGVAPATIITAEHDILRGEGEAYADRLRADGTQVELINYPQVHGFFNLIGQLDVARDAVDKAATALGKARSSSR